MTEPAPGRWAPSTPFVDRMLEMQYPRGTVERCCATCGMSSANYDHYGSWGVGHDARSARPLRMTMSLSCYRFCVSTWAWARCGEFIHRADFKGFPDLPPRISEVDRRNDEGNGW